jgi:putative transcriptional regulator
VTPPAPSLPDSSNWADRLGVAPRLPEGRIDLTAFLDDDELTRWRWAGPGVRVAPLPRLIGVGERAHVVAAARRATLPSHGHRGEEMVLVLRGGFDDDRARYDVGDVGQSDAAVRHAPVADRWLGCICLIVTDARLRMSGIARLLQPFSMP